VTQLIEQALTLPLEPKDLAVCHGQAY